MKNDKKIRDIIAEIEYQCRQYLDFTSSLNECAYSDRFIEKIIKNTKMVEILYNKQFQKTKKIYNQKER